MRWVVGIDPGARATGLFAVRNDGKTWFGVVETKRERRPGAQAEADGEAFWELFVGIMSCLETIRSIHRDAEAGPQASPLDEIGAICYEAASIGKGDRAEKMMAVAMCAIWDVVHRLGVPSKSISTAAICSALLGEARGYKDVRHNRLHSMHPAICGEILGRLGKTRGAHALDALSVVIAACARRDWVTSSLQDDVRSLLRNGQPHR